MSYGSKTNIETRIRGNSRTTKTESKEKKSKSNTSQKKPTESGGRKKLVKRLTKVQMERLKEHAKLHKGGMSSQHMKKMIFVMTREGKSFDVAHKIAVNHIKNMKAKKK